ncbi:MAG: hypothetical protein HZA81_04480 [Candidatus Taylorbacteria bacterium]|nr:hypothetical protein [Candidatus Taylorbacteria bacterium]
MSHVARRFGIAMLSVMTLVLPIVASAQAFEPQKAVVLARIAVLDGVIQGQEGNALSLSFRLKNDGEPTAAIRYSAVLYDESMSAQAHEYVAPEELSLGGREVREISFTYKVPDALSGTYKLALRAQLSSGMPLSLFVFPQTVTFESKGGGLVVDQGSCLLRVEGEDESKFYTTRQGVDILPSESLVGSCFVRNTGTEEVSARAAFDTYQRSRSGPRVGDQALSSELYAFASGEEKRVDLRIPSPQEAQAYDAVAYFVSEGKAVSNDVDFHYVVRGASATIQTFSLDKVSYAVGEEARARLVWSRSADSFPDSRLGSGSPLASPMATVSLFSGKDRCASDQTVPLDRDGVPTEFSIAIEEKCPDVRALVSISDEGRPLASFDYKVELPRAALPWKTVAYGAFGAVLLAALVAFKLRSKDRSGAIPLAMLLLAGALLSPQLARAGAQTVTWTDRGNNNLSGTITVADSFNEGSDVTFTADFSKRYQWCTNGATRDLTFGYKILNSQDEVVAHRGAIRTEVVSENVGQLAVGSYRLIASFGEGNGTITGYTDSTCTTYVDYDGDGYDDDSYEVQCRIPIYGDLANAELPFTVNAVAKSPDGWVDSADCNAINGWTFDADSEATSIQVHFYNGPAGSGQWIGAITADSGRPDVNQAYGISGNHGFSFTPPASLKTGAEINVYAYGIGVNSSGGNDGLNSQLSGTPKTFRCAVPDVCANIAGDQASVPGDRVQSGPNCVCPADKVENGSGQCVAPDLGTPTVNVSASPRSISPGGSVTVSSVAEGSGLTHHGFEERYNGGAWQNIGGFSPISGQARSVSRNPSFEGTYEYRAYASNTNGASYVYASPVSVSVTSAPQPSQCSNGLDDDNDGLIDYPSDPGCTGSSDNDEYNTVVINPINGISYISVPSPVAAGTDFSVRARNSGTKPWGSSHDLLLATADLSSNIALADLDPTISGGDKVVTFRAPSIPGTYALRAVEQNVEYFGQNQSFQVTANSCDDCGTTDVCPNIAGTQSSVPNGMTVDGSGNCVTSGSGTGGNGTNPGGGTNNPPGSGFTVSGTSIVPIQFIADLPAKSQNASISINPVSFSAPVVLSVQSIASAQGAALPQGVTPTYYFGDREVSSMLLTFDPNIGTYRDSNGAIGTTFSVKLSKKVAESYFVTLIGSSGTRQATMRIEVDPNNLNPEFREF